MSKRYVALSLSVVLALVLAVPAFGGPSNPVANSAASLKKTATSALKTAKSARKAARKAQTTADSATSKANSAQTAANKAQTDATSGINNAAAAQTAATAAQTSADSALAAANAAQASANGKVSNAGQRVEGTPVAGAVGGTLAGVNCPAGTKVTGGGFAVSGTDNNEVTVTLSTEFYNDNWIAQARNQAGQAGTNWDLTAEGTCATSP
jgi:trimeric autotransporter adhesin